MRAKGEREREIEGEIERISAVLLPFIVYMLSENESESTRCHGICEIKICAVDGDGSGRKRRRRRRWKCRVLWRHVSTRVTHHISDGACTRCRNRHNGLTSAVLTFSALTTETDYMAIDSRHTRFCHSTITKDHQSETTTTWKKSEEIEGSWAWLCDKFGKMLIRLGGIFFYSAACVTNTNMNIFNPLPIQRGARRLFLQLVHAKRQTNKSTNLLHKNIFHRLTESPKQTYRLQFTRSPHEKNDPNTRFLTSHHHLRFSMRQTSSSYAIRLRVWSISHITWLHPNHLPSQTRRETNNDNNNNDNKNHVYARCWISVWTTKIINYQMPIRIFGCESEPVHLLLFYTWYGKYPIINAFVPTSSLAYIDPNAHNSGSRVPWRRKRVRLSSLGWGLTYTGIIRMCDFRQWKKINSCFYSIVHRHFRCARHVCGDTVTQQWMRYLARRVPFLCCAKFNIYFVYSVQYKYFRFHFRMKPICSLRATNFREIISIRTYGSSVDYFIYCEATRHLVRTEHTLFRRRCFRWPFWMQSIFYHIFNIDSFTMKPHRLAFRIKLDVLNWYISQMVQQIDENPDETENCNCK